MIKFIKSLFASTAHTKARISWARHQRADALGQIYRAVNLEANPLILAKHLIFKGEIELALDKREDSVISLNRAKEIIETHPDCFAKPSNMDTVAKLNNAFRNA